MGLCSAVLAPINALADNPGSIILGRVMNQNRPARILIWGCGVAAAAAILNGVYWLVAWANGAAPQWAAAGMLTVKTNMALGQVLTGIAFLLLRPTQSSPLARRVGIVAAGIALFIGGLTVVEHVLGVNLRIDQLLAHEAPGAAGTLSPNRMGLPGSSSLTLLGAGLLVIPWRRRWTPYFGLAVCLINLAPLLGFLYHAEELYRHRSLLGISASTVIVLIALGIGLMLAEDRAGPVALLKREDPGGRLFRQWLPAIVLLPIVLGFLRVQGERHDLYDMEFGTAMLVLALVLIFSLLLWRSAEYLSRATRAQAAAELGKRALAQQRKLALDAAQLGWWHYDPIADFITGDERFREIFNLGPEQRANRELLARIHPDDLDRVKVAAQAALRSGEAKPFSVEHRIVAPDGRVHWLLAHAIVSFEADGESRCAVALSGTVQDITERKRVEEAMRQSEQRYRLLFDRNPDGVFVVDATGRFTVVNPACEIISGYSSAELLHRTFTQLCAPDQLARTVEQFGHNIRDRTYTQLETALIRKDGRRVELWISGEPIVQEDKVVSVHCTVRDITERKRVETVLRESEEQFRTLADSIPNLAWWADGDGYITWYNRRWYEYTGTTPQQMQGWGWQGVHDPAMLPKVLERWKSSIATGEPFEMEFPLRGADGGYRWFLTRIIPLRDSSGKVLRWFGTNTDVSETREAREVLARGKQELERLVAERTAKLQELVGELEHFSYSITHDMRAPLRAMKGFAEVVDELSTDAQPELRQFVRRIMTAADRMDSLIRDALNYSRAVRQELPLEPVDSGALLRGMLDSYPELQPSKALIQVQGQLPMVMANEAGLTQCFSNLLGNAVKFVQPGQTPHIRVRAEPRNEWIRIWVEDNGIGIAASMMPRIFDMFSRGHNNYEGTGIGLALVRKVVQRMGGKVGVESEEGKGSRFWIELKPWEKPGAGPAADVML